MAARARIRMDYRMKRKSHNIPNTCNTSQIRYIIATYFFFRKALIIKYLVRWIMYNRSENISDVLHIMYACVCARIVIVMCFCSNNTFFIRSISGKHQSSLDKWGLQQQEE